MNQTESQQQEYCPSCGNFVDEIDLDSGWCLECTGDSKARCLNCDELFTKDQPHRKLCGHCREERWLLQHADELEDYLVRGATFAFAKREVYHNNRPRCTSCGDPIKNASNGAMFCTQRLECRRWRRRYRTVREQNERRSLIDPAKMALAQVSAEIFAEKHRMKL